MSSVPPARSTRQGALAVILIMLVESQATIAQPTRGKMGLVEHAWAEFASHEDALRSNLAYYRRLSPQQRLDILLELITSFRKEEDASSQRLERVCRVSQLPRR